MAVGAASGLAAASPWSAAAGAAAQIASVPNVTKTGDVGTGAKTIGGLNFAPSATSQATTMLIVAAAVIVLLLLLSKK